MKSRIEEFVHPQQYLVTIIVAGVYVLLLQEIWYASLKIAA